MIDSTHRTVLLLLQISDRRLMLKLKLPCSTFTPALATPEVVSYKISSILVSSYR
jgi:hypothetical protein